jgi:peroxiredoxin
LKKLIAGIFLVVVFCANINAQTYYEFTSTDLDGNEVSLSKLLDKGPVLIGFWATWCSPCKEEMKEMQKIYDKYKAQGFTYLALNQDNQKSLSKVKPFIESHSYTFPVAFDTDQKIYEGYSGGEDIPYSILIDMNKNVVAVHRGYLSGDEKKIEAEIKALLTK